MQWSLDDFLAKQLDQKDESERRIEELIDEKADEIKKLYSKIEEMAETDEANTKTQNLKKSFEK